MSSNKNNKLELLEKLQSRVAQFHEESKDLSESLQRIVEKLDDGYILSTEECTETVGKITSVKELRKLCETSYNDFDRDELPATFDEFSEEVKQIEALLDKTEYIEARDFLLRLNIHDKAIALIFDRLKKDLRAIDIERLSPEECASTLQKYVDLKNLLSCKPQEKAGYMLRIVNEFDEAILSLAFTGDYSVGDNDDGEAAAETIEEEAEEKEEPVEEEIALSVSADESPDMETSDPEEAADVKRGNNVDISLYVGILEEAGYIEPDISNVKIEKEFAKTQASKPFSIKKFKDMIKSSPMGVDTINVLRNLSTRVVLGDRMDPALEPVMSETRYRECLEFLVRKGYVQKLHAERFPLIYSLTNKGAELISSKSACEYVKCLHISKEAMAPVVNNSAATYLSLAMRMMANDYIPHPSRASEAFYYDGFATVAELPDDTHTVFTGCASDSKENVAGYLAMLSFITEDLIIEDLHIFGVTKENAESLAEVIKKMPFSAYDPEMTSIHLHALKTETTPSGPSGPDRGSASKEADPVKSVKAAAKGKSTENTKSKKRDEVSKPESESAEQPSLVKAKSVTQQALYENVKTAGMAIDVFSADDKPHCAAVYAAAAAKQHPETEGVYSRFAYAVNDPAAHCTYTSDNLFGAFTDFERESEYYYQAASVLRLFYAGQSRYDYNLQQIHDSIKGNPALSDNQALNDLIFALRNFRSDTGFSVDRYADYRSHDRVELERELKALKAEAASYYENDFVKQRMVRTKTINRRYEATWRGVFSKEEDLGVCVKAVSDDDIGYVGLAKDYLETNFIKEGMPVLTDNIDPRKVEVFIDDEWNKALDQVALRMKSSDLMGGLRNNLRSHIYKSLSALCSWIEIHEALGDDKDKGHAAYAAIRDKLLTLTEEAISASEAQLDGADTSKKAGLKVLIRTIDEIRRKIDGSYDSAEQKYFYAGFLRTNNVILGEDYLPDMECMISGVAGMNMSELIEKHLADRESTLESNLDDYCQDNYGTARLIAAYLYKMEGKSPEILKTLPEAEKYAAGQLELVHKDFVSDIELAQSYGQLDSDDAEDRKDSILRMADKWYGWAEETCNYGFYKGLLNEMREQVKRDASGRGLSILHELDTLLEHDRTLERDHAEYIGKIRKTIIERQNYLVAEDMINNLLSGDIPTETELFEYDYLADFQSKYSYYYKLSGTSGQALSNRVKTNDLKGLSAKDTKGAIALKNSWPNPGRAVTPENLKVMLTALGMDIDKITLSDQANSIFNVRLKRPLHEDEKSYGHPIYAFGSMGAREGFRVIWLSGSYNADALIAKMSELGKGRHTIAFLDHPITEAERRRLARKIKEEGSSRIFGVIDRVLYMYLIHNYSETYIGRMLMETMMPFAYFQPYIYDSATVMPPEMFMGRKDELEKIKDPAGVNIVYGGRQLGKSALLRKAKTDINGESDRNRAVLIDIKDLDYKKAAKKIAQTLYDEKVLEEPVADETSWEEIARAVKNTLNGSRKIGYFLLMLDEADAFIESCEATGYAPFNALKDIQTSVDAGRFKFVVAGLRNVVRFNKAATSGNSVLPHLEPLAIKPFTMQEARMLLEQPLYYLGFRFPEGDSDLVPMILATANRFPGLVQLYCAKLIEALKKSYGDYDEANTPPYVIEEGLIKRVLAESDFRNQIRQKFMITLTIGKDDYYYILALILAYLYRNYDREGGYTASEILEVAKDFSTKRISEMTTDQIDALMTELCELNVIRVTAENRYLFSRYNFFTMMGTSDEVDERLLSFSEEGVPEED